jgi:hypothetical protein
MATTKHYSELDSNYLPTDGSVPIALGVNAIELAVVAGKVSQSVDLTGFDKLSFVAEADGANIAIDFLEILGMQDTTATITIVESTTASSGYALRMTGAQKLIFGTRISYVSDILKKITLKARKDNANTGELYASVASYANGQVINKLGVISLDNYVAAVPTTGVEYALSDTFEKRIGYIKGVNDVTNSQAFTEPAHDPNFPTLLPYGTDEVALILESTGAADIYDIDVISLEEVENDIRNIPEGQGVYDGVVNFNTRNDRLTAVPNTPAVVDPTSPSSYILNGDGSVDITFAWTFDDTLDAGNIDGFIIYLHSDSVVSYSGRHSRVC